MMEKYSMVAVLEFGNTYSEYAAFKKFETDKQVHNDPPWKFTRKPLQAKKTRTCILINKNKTLEDFGDAAEGKFATYETGDRDRMFYFRQFQSTLYTEKEINASLELKDETGKFMAAEIVFTQFFLGLSNELITELNTAVQGTKPIQKNKLRWVITVPADLTDNAKQLVKSCAEKAGITHDSLILATESDVAFAYCQQFLERDQYSKLDVKTEYMIVDLQDCVVDIRVVKKTSDLIIQKYRTIKDHRGASMYEKFLLLLKEIFGTDIIDHFLKENIFASSDIKQGMKRASVIDSEKRRINVDSLIQFYNKSEDHLQSSTKESLNKKKITIEGVNMILDGDTFQKIFRPMIDIIISEMENVYKFYKKASKVKFIVLTGDFCDCSKNAIGIKFSQKRIILPKSDEGPVMKGACLYGHQPYQYFSEVPCIITEDANYKPVVSLHLGTTYCGYAFSLQPDPEQIHITPTWRCEKKGLLKKTSSCICLDADKKCLGIGYEAEQIYADYLKKHDDKQICFFRPLKALLHDEMNINQDIELQTPNRKMLKAKTIFYEFIDVLVKETMIEIKRKHPDANVHDIRWVITVPVGQTKNTGRFVKYCTDKGIIPADNLLVVTEVEAAFADCQHFLERDQSSKLEDSIEYMIVNLGGCVADIRVVKKISDTMIEICRTRDDYSKESVYTNMQDSLPELQQAEASPISELDFERALEEIKCNIHGTRQIRVPSAYNDVFKTYAKTHKLQMNEDQGDEVMKVVDNETFQAIFQPTIDAVTSHIKNVFENYKEAHKVEYIVMTGDFYECCLLKHAIEIEFPQKRIIFSKSDEEAVMKGAILFRQQPYQYILQSLHAYEKKPGQKGLLLVINFQFREKPKERKGSDEDVKKLRSFFTNLNYDVLCYSDMTTGDLKKLLKYVRNSYLKEKSQKYHCFMCVIMSHGCEKGIRTSDSNITVDRLLKPFRNDEADRFIGKPKIFMVQTCRGGGVQDKYKPPEAFGNSKEDDVETRMPKDSDILIIYASSPGYKSTREMTSPKWKGAWLIQAFLCVAELYPKKHLLELLTAVNFELARNPEYEGFGGKCQVSMSESALSKLFYL